jgi:integrase
MTTQATISPTTIALYGDKFRRIRHRVAFLAGVESDESVSPLAIVRYLVESKPNWAKRTWTLYRCAVRFNLRQAAAYADESELGAYSQALNVLDSETQEQAKRKGSATSSKKAKKLSQNDVSTLIDYVRAQKGQRLAIQACAFVIAALATGLRPSEWPGAKLSQEPDGTWLLTVRNAKATNGRGNGSSRTLRLIDVSAQELVAIEGMTLIAAVTDQEPGGYPGWQKRLRHYLYRAARAALGRRANYPSLYTFRHQFAANAKANHSREEVAAMMGHGSAATAGRNYAKRRQAGGAIRVAPVASEVGTVRSPRSAIYNPDRKHATGFGTE